MSWLDVLKLFILMLGAMCVVCVSISMYSDGQAKTMFISKAGRYPSKHDIPD